MKTPTFVLSLALAAAASAQEVRYEKFVLENGLTVILHEDHSTPQVVVNLWYRVGGKDERPGRSGFAHLFEHLMFLGTERAPGSAFDDLMEAGGGFNNASTSFDRTNYYDVGPSELLPTLLWLEADRMEALGAATTQAKLDGEREVVRNERRQSYEDQPYGVAYLAQFPLLYPEGHPYHDPVIGSHAELEAATLEDVRSFFAEYYVPNNASLVVAGDFQPEAVRAEVTRLFGSIPRQADPAHRRAGPVTFTQNATVTLTDPLAPFARTNLCWHSPGVFQAGDAELDLAATILAEGVSSRLYRALVVEHELAEEVEAFQSSRMLGSHFVVSAMARPGVDLATLERRIEEVLAGFLADGPTEDELARAQAKVEAASLRSLQSLQTKADRLNLYEMHFGEPDAFAADLDRYRTATTAGVRKVLSEVLGAQRRVQRVLPVRVEPDTNPRDARPTPAAPTSFEPRSPSIFQLSNGITVHHWHQAELPMVEATLLLPFGAGADPAGKAGLTDLMAQLQTRGAGERDAAAFANALDRMGGSLTASVSQETTQLKLSALARHFEGTLGLLADGLLRPRFAPEEWARLHRERQAALALEAEDPGSLARQIGLATFFPQHHPHAHRVMGSPRTVARLELNDVVSQYARVVRPDGVRILVAGDIDRAQLAAALEKAFGGWKGLLSSPSASVGELGGPQRPLRVVLHDRPGATQTAVRFLLPAVAHGDPARPAHDLVATVLGGSFTSRLNTNLRVERGITYGAGAGFVRGPRHGHFVAFSRIEAEHTGEGVGAFLDEFARLRSGDLTEEEAHKARAQRRLDAIRSFAGLVGLVETGAQLASFGRTVSDLADELGRVAQLDAAALNAVAPQLGDLEGAVLVLVGDAEKIVPQLEGLGLPAPIAVDAEGKPLE